MIGEIIVSVFLIIGAAFALIGSVGLIRLPDFFQRLHGPTKATTLGVGGIVIGSALFFSLKTPEISVHELLIAVFLFLTAPVSAHLMARAALHRNAASRAAVPGEPEEEQQD